LSVIPATATIAPAATQTFDVYIEPDTADDRTWDYTGEIILFTDACPDTEVHVAVHVHVVVPLEQVPPLPRSTRLLPAYPNPFNGVATIRYALESPSIVSLALFDVTGRKARVLESGPRTAGEHAVSLDGSGLASGTYVVRLAAGGTFYSQSVVLLR